ncbi:hypothetical protein [Streptomyces sp. NPDC052107]|uniref:hypothetical protein n=1 Tax=Streptomyces sp. NPDC052107 TaxID=3155632 RepID=UPI0034220C6F
MPRCSQQLPHRQRGARAPYRLGCRSARCPASRRLLRKNRFPGGSGRYRDAHRAGLRAAHLDTPNRQPYADVRGTDHDGRHAHDGTPATPRPHLTNASAVVSQYYQDITDHDYAAAWALGGSHIAGTTYDRWVAGFATTQNITLGTISAFGASRVHAILYATQTDGTLKTYAGDYTIADGILVGASIHQAS